MPHRLPSPTREVFKHLRKQNLLKPHSHSGEPERHAPHTGTGWGVLGVGGGRTSICNCRGLPRGEGAHWSPKGRARTRKLSGSHAGRRLQPAMLGGGGSAPKVEGSRQGG